MKYTVHIEVWYEVYALDEDDAKELAVDELTVEVAIGAIKNAMTVTEIPNG